MTNGFAERWAANSHLYADDIVQFGHDQWRLRDVPPGADVGPDNTIRLMDHQQEILREMFRRHPDGRPVYRLRVWSTIKKSGKTEVEGIVALHAALTEAGTPYIYFVGNDKEQAQTRAFEAIMLQINPDSKAFNPVVASHFIQPRSYSQSLSYIGVKGGGYLKSIPVDFAGEAGGNPLASMWDELWGADREAQRRLWDEMTPPPTRPNSFRFVATYAGFRNESALLWDIYKRIVGGDKAADRKKHRIHPTLPLYVSEAGDEIAYWDEGKTARRMPWQTEDYYRSERAAMRPEAFKRIHENLWADNETPFLTAEKYDKLPRYVRDAKALNPEGYPLYIGIDAAHKRDTTTGVVMAWTPEVTDSGRHKLRVIDRRTWRPTPGKVVIPEDTALPWAREWIATGNVYAVGYDPNHFETPAERLREDYPTLDVRAISPTASNMTAIGSGLYDVIHYEALEVYDEADDDPDALRKHILNAVAVETMTGWRISKGTDKNKVDGAIAAGNAVLLANERGFSDFESGSGIYIFGGNDDEDY